jgi:DMSO/TMAO reductase YedYZ molybdopterin-dependent catalytic subunit
LTEQHKRELDRLIARRRFMQQAGAGAAVIAFAGSLWIVSDELTATARAETRADGRPRLPPGQHVIQRLRPMGGDQGDPDPAHFRLRVHGEVEHPMTLDFHQLLALPQVTQAADVHCVTRWTALGIQWTGVRLGEIAKRAGITRRARHVIFEAAHGYTSNIPIHEALKPNVMVAYRIDGHALPRAHGSPVRAVVPDRYFWKSAKWLTGIWFSERDHPGYWERRGYDNNADPWLEQRTS